MNYTGYNPYGGYGQPNPAAMYQQAYMQQMQQMQAAQQAQQPNLVARLVTSRDEATTAQITFDSTINIFVNLAAGEVYIKRFNPNTGGADFIDFISAARLKQEAEQAQTPEYVTMDVFSALEQRVGELAESISARRAARTVNNDE